MYFLSCEEIKTIIIIIIIIIPSTEISQQSSSVDCGVFVVKWAQHIVEGRPSGTP